MLSILSLDNLESLDADAKQTLRDLGVNSVGDLVRFAPYERALVLARWARRDIPHDLDLGPYLDGEVTDLERAVVLELPVARLRGVGEVISARLSDAFGVATIADLLGVPAFKEAESLLEGRGFREPPSAPSELLPDLRQRSSSRFRYRSWTRRPTRTLASLRLVPCTVRLDPQAGAECPPRAIDLLLVSAFSQKRRVRYATGLRLITAQDWRGQGFVLGDVQHTLGLAPGQMKRIATLRWDRRKRGQRGEETDVTETLDNLVTREQSAEEAVRDLVIEKTRDAEATFDTSVESRAKARGFALSAGQSGGASASGGLSAFGAPFNLAGSVLGAVAGLFSSSKITTSAEAQGHIHEDVTESTGIDGSIVSSIADWTRQAASSVRSLRSMVVLEVGESVVEEAETSIVVNYNRGHALNLTYYQLLRRSLVHTGVAEALPVLYLPFAPHCFTLEDIIALWPRLRPAVRENMPQAFADWDRHLQAGFGKAHTNADAENLRVRSIRTVNRLGVPITVTLSAAGDRWELDALRGTRVHRAPVTFDEPASELRSLKLESGPLFESMVRRGVFRIELELVDADGGSVAAVAEARLEVIDLGSVPPDRQLVQLRGSVDVRDVVEATLARRYDEAAHDLSFLLRHVQEYAREYTRYLLATADIADVQDVLDGLCVARDDSELSLSQVVDTSRILGLTGRHLVLPLRRPPPGDAPEPDPGRETEPNEEVDPFQESRPRPRVATPITTLPDIDTVFAQAEAARAAPRQVQFVETPTDGLFCEAVLGRANGAEYVDPRRFIAWQENPIPHQAPTIEAVSFGQNDPTGEESLRPTEPSGRLTPVAPISSTPFAGFDSLLPAALSASPPAPATGAFTGILEHLSGLAANAAEQARELSGDLGKSAMEGAVDLGKQVADMTRTSMEEMPTQASEPPKTQTERAAALNELDGIEERAQRRTDTSDADPGSPNPAGRESGPSPQAVDDARARAVGVPIRRSDPPPDQSPGRVTSGQEVEIDIDLFIPADVVAGPRVVPSWLPQQIAQLHPMLGPVVQSTPAPDWFLVGIGGDNRTAPLWNHDSYRVRVRFRLILDPAHETGIVQQRQGSAEVDVFRQFGPTKEYDLDDLVAGPRWWSHVRRPGATALRTNVLDADDSNLKVDLIRQAGGGFTVTVSINATLPAENFAFEGFAPGIHGNLLLEVQPGQFFPTVEVQGTHDPFPSWSIFANRIPVYTRSADPTVGPLGLFTPALSLTQHRVATGRVSIPTPAP